MLICGRLRADFGLAHLQLASRIFGLLWGLNAAPLWAHFGGLILGPTLGSFVAYSGGQLQLVSGPFWWLWLGLIFRLFRAHSGSQLGLIWGAFCYLLRGHFGFVTRPIFPPGRMLYLVRAHFVASLGPFWAHVDAHLGLASRPCWGSFWARFVFFVLGSFRANCAAPFRGCLGRLWAHFMIIFGRFLG